jgi:deazaflavin-dependent oxidoreductase (nitroreductase family)
MQSPGVMGRFLRRGLYRLPIWLRSVGLFGYERLLGIEWVVLTTRGRRTHRPHAVVLDVIGRDERTSTWYVSPSNGRRSAWVGNALAHPRVTLAVGRRELAARARDASGSEGADVFLRFIREHPRYATLVARLGAFADVSGRSDDEARAHLRELVVIALTAETGAPVGQRSSVRS